MLHINIHYNIHISFRPVDTSLKESPKVVIDCLKLKFPEFDDNSWKERFEWGGIFVNGRPVEMNTKLSDFTSNPRFHARHASTPPCVVYFEYFQPRVQWKHRKDQYPRFNSKFILYNHEGVLISFKPSMLSTKPSKAQKHCSLYSYLTRYLADQGKWAFFFNIY